MTPQELDERIDDAVREFQNYWELGKGDPDAIKKLIKDCIEAVRPANQEGYYGYCGCDGVLEQDIKELLG